MTALKCVLKNVNTEGRKNAKNCGALLVRCPGCTVRRMSRSCNETAIAGSAEWQCWSHGTP